MQWRPRPGESLAKLLRFSDRIARLRSLDLIAPIAREILPMLTLTLRRLLLVFSLMFSLVPALTYAQEGSWEFVDTIDGVKVWRKQVPGSDLMAFKGEITANVHIGKIISTFLDRDQRKHWVDRFAEQKLLEKSGPMSETYWIHFALPFPIKDRDYVLKADGQVDQTAHVFTARIKSVRDPRKGEDDCCVRAEAKNTYYRFEALPGTERTKMTVEVHTDPKGSLPDWLINLIQKKWPSKTLTGLIARAKAQNQIQPEMANWHEAPAAP